MKRTWMAGLGVAAGILAAGTASAQTEFNASIWFPDTHPLTGAGYVQWVEQLEEASDGDLVANLFTGSALLPPSAHLSGLQDGIAQVTYHAGTYTPSELPEDNTLSILGLGLRDIMTAGFAVTDFYMNDPEMQARFKELGIVFAGGYATPQYHLMCSTEVASLEDLEGLKIRMPGPIHADWARSVGATPVNVPSSEMFTGLERGQLDCAANAANDLKSRSLWDVAKYVNLVPLGSYFAGWEWAFNAGFWQGLSDDQRRVMLDTISSSLVDALLAYESASMEALEEAPDHGVTIHEPSEEMLASVNEFANNVAPETAIEQGTDQFGLEDPEDLIKRFEETLAKWDKLLEGVDRTDGEALKEILYNNLYAEVDASSYGIQ